MTKLKEYYKLVLFIGLVLLIVLQFENVMKGVANIFDVFSTIIVGAVLAVVMNVPIKKVEQYIAKTKLPQKLQKPISLVIVFIMLILILVAIGFVVIPTVVQTVTQLSGIFKQTIDKLYDLTLVNDSDVLPEGVVQDVLNQVKSNSGTISSTIVNFLRRMTGNIGGVFSSVMNGIIAIIFMLSFIANKWFIKRVTKRLFNVLLPPKLVEKMTYVAQLSSQTYEKFLIGQIIEAFIIGGLMFLVYKLFNFPYAGMVGVLTGVLSFIPYVGPFIACGLGAIFIFAINPVQAVWSIVIFQIVQLIENNLIYPRVVGSSVGLPSMLTLVAATVGGSLFGLAGMVFFTPIFAVIYQLVREYVVKKEQEQLELANNYVKNR